MASLALPEVENFNKAYDALLSRDTEITEESLRQAIGLGSRAIEVLHRNSASGARVKEVQMQLKQLFLVSGKVAAKELTIDRTPAELAAHQYEILSLLARQVDIEMTLRSKHPAKGYNLPKLGKINRSAAHTTKELTARLERGEAVDLESHTEDALLSVVRRYVKRHQELTPFFALSACSGAAEEARIEEMRVAYTKLTPTQKKALQSLCSILKNVWDRRSQNGWSSLQGFLITLGFVPPEMREGLEKAGRDLTALRFSIPGLIGFTDAKDFELLLGHINRFEGGHK